MVKWPDIIGTFLQIIEALRSVFGRIKEANNEVWSCGTEADLSDNTAEQSHEDQLLERSAGVQRCSCGVAASVLCVPQYV